MAVGLRSLALPRRNAAGAFQRNARQKNGLSNGTLSSARTRHCLQPGALSCAILRGEPLKAEGSHPRANFGRPRNRHASVAGTTGTLGLAIAQKQVCSKTTFELPVERGRQRDQIAKLIFFCGRPHAPAPTRPVSLALLTYRGQFRSPLAAPSTSDTISNSNALSIRDLLPRFPFFLGDRKIQPDNAPLSAVCAFCAFDSVT